jgi:kynureninase
MMQTNPRKFESRKERYALDLDARDPLGSYRERFLIPSQGEGSPSIYFAGNSLGLQPRTVREAVVRELDAWARLAVRGHFEGEKPWYTYHDLFLQPLARLVGGEPHEVVLMNGLTVNLHLLLASFYRPRGRRNKMLIDGPTFPSDRYAVATHLRHHGLDPQEALIEVGPRGDEDTLRIDDVEGVLEREGDDIAVVLMGGVNFLTGQLLDIARIARSARERGCIVGFDLAHAVGNVELCLHEWDVDFAAWCGYKYLNGGPGAPAGCFIHERHARNVELHRFGGWWGNDPATRFKMQLLPEFVPVASASGWQLSNPPILAMAPLLASLEIFSEAGMPQLRKKSKRLTGFLEFLLDDIPDGRVRILTPRDPESRGCQLSIRVDGDARVYQRSLEETGVVCDFREPDVVRVAPTPLYNTFHEAWRFARILADTEAP